MPPLNSMDVAKFIKMLKASTKSKGKEDEKFAFFLGAGCSVSSGIGDATTMVRDWLKELKKSEGKKGQDLDKWIRINLPNFPDHNPALFYEEAMDRLFPFLGNRQAEIERLCKGRFPGYGYGTLAQLMATAGGQFNVALTTNFDDLLADAFYFFTLSRPLVIPHESLAGFIFESASRPLILKLHGDARLRPQITSQQTATIKPEVAERVRRILLSRCLIFLGYGGNDNGIRDMLAKLSKDDLRFGAYWVGARYPHNELKPWLEDVEAKWVKCADFDSLMVSIRKEFNLSHPSREGVDEAFRNYRSSFEAVYREIRGNRDAPVSLRKAASAISKAFPAGWGVPVRQRLDTPTKTPPQPAGPASPNSPVTGGAVAEDVAERRDDATVPPLSEAGTSGHASSTDVDPKQKAEPPGGTTQPKELHETGRMILIPAGPFRKGFTTHQVKEIVAQLRAENLELDWDSVKSTIAEAEPPQSVSLAAFWIDETPVTNAQFSLFVRETIYVTQAERENDDTTWRKQDVPSMADHPVVYVSYDDVLAYCKWAGKRLPTADEWKKACRGPNGNIYPWGDHFDAQKCNTAESQSGWETTPVLMFKEGKSFYQCYDMVGNVEEWTSSKNEDRSLVILGGSWEMTCQVYGLPVLHRRARPNFYSRDLGFRCARDA